MNQRILVVDDEPDMLILLQRILQGKTNYEIITTNNSLEVPDLLEKQFFDVIITDLSMPKLDGLDILELVQDRGSRELVVLITAYGGFDSSEKARKLGVYDYIRKPFKREQILQTVEAAMQEQRQRRQSE
ncbi:MAG TPA: response regulator [Bacteroidetes bacterium]|nr:nitrogen regulation protein [bacterium BMS3Bbin04]HDO65702.1 response regulator [Bacteroidota bacterium]HEX04827.1 response regulator [Bacteroidota bacterium]